MGAPGHLHTTPHHPPLSYTTISKSTTNLLQLAMSKKRRSTRIMSSKLQKQQKSSKRSQVRKNHSQHALLSFDKRIQQVANESSGPYWLTEDTEFTDTQVCDGIDLSLWMSNSGDFQTERGISPSSVPIDFSKEWENIVDPLYCCGEYDNSHHDESSRDSTQSMDSARSNQSVESTDSLTFMEYSDDEKVGNSRAGAEEITTIGPQMEDMSLWCHESQVEDVPGHELNLRLRLRNSWP